MRRGDPQAGSVAVETAIVAPGMLLVLALLIFAGRTAIAEGTVEQATFDAARAASLARTASQAAADARMVAAQSLTNQDLTCSTTSVQVDTAGFTTPPGQPGQVTTTITCVIQLSDLALPGLPGRATITAMAVSPVDTYRERR